MRKIILLFVLSMIFQIGFSLGQVMSIIQHEPDIWVAVIEIVIADIYVFILLALCWLYQSVYKDPFYFDL